VGKISKKGENMYEKQNVLCMTSITFCGLLIVGNANSATPINETKLGMTDVISRGCQQGPTVNSADFQNRCNALAIGVSGPGNLVPVISGNQNVINGAELSDTEVNTLVGAVGQIAPEQQIVPGVQATRTMSSIQNIANTAVISRLGVLRAQMRQAKGVRYANRFDRNSGYFSFASNGFPSGGSAGIADSNRLSIWGNGTYFEGNVDTSSNQLGFGFDNWGGTVGVDYRITDEVVAGASFSYLGTNANVDNSGSRIKSDSYTGSIFAMYTHDSGFYVDGVASYGGADFDITRSIQYTFNGDDVNASAKGTPGGLQYSVGAGVGYQYTTGATTIEPYARADYRGLEIDSFDESESGLGVGWASHFSRQRVRSLPTTVGMRLNHAFSTSWGIIQPQINGAWHHEFKDNQRNIQTRFLGNGGDLRYNIVTESPDNNYFTVGASISFTLPHGITAFTGYSRLLGYHNITSQRVTFGGRMEL